MNKVGLIDIKKAYFGDKSLSPNNAFIGTYPLLYSVLPAYLGLKFKVNGGNVSIKLLSGLSGAPDMKYSLDNGTTWILWASSHSSGLWSFSTISINNGDEICFKGSNYSLGGSSESLFTQFIISGSGTITASGSIMSLLDNGAGTMTSVSSNCFRRLFKNCSKLTTAPELPAPTVSGYGYYEMFYGCTGLTSAPELPAATLNICSYMGMFGSCSSLRYVKCLAKDISAYKCLQGWLSGVSSTGTFVKDANTTWPSGTSGIPSNWTIQND